MSDAKTLTRYPASVADGSGIDLPRAAAIARSSLDYCDVYEGRAEDLISAGIIHPDHLLPQKGRPTGRTAFHPDGRPCPPHIRAWRDPGFVSVEEQEGGMYRVAITVAKEMQKLRRDSTRASRLLADAIRLSDAAENEAHLYRNWKLRQEIGPDAECWEGTKAQLQAAGLGVGLAFPGEPGAPDRLVCACPLGFEFSVYLPGMYAAAKVAAGIYTAVSAFVPWDRSLRKLQYTEFAPGVVLQIWNAERWDGDVESFRGSSAALIAAGLVPDLKYFPGQPGANKVRASYRADWSHASNANGQMLAASITRHGPDKFAVEVPIDDAEKERRQQIRSAHEAERAGKQRTLAAERKKLRHEAATARVVHRAEPSQKANHLRLVWAGKPQEQTLKQPHGPRLASVAETERSAADSKGASPGQWRLSPELLAALQSADANTLRSVENMIRSYLDLPFLPRLP